MTSPPFSPSLSRCQTHQSNYSTESTVVPTIEQPSNNLKRKRDSEGESKPVSIMKEKLTFLPGWEVHPAISTEMKRAACWEDFANLALEATKVWAIGGWFDVRLDQTHRKFFTERAHPSTNRIHVVKMKAGSMDNWDREMAVVKEVFDEAYVKLLDRIRGTDLEHRVKECFATHQDHGVDGDKWWKDTVEFTILECKKWYTMAYTLEPSLMTMARSTARGQRWDEIRVYADVLYPTPPDQDLYTTTREELVYVLRGGKVMKKARLAWISDELLRSVKPLEEDI